MIYTDSNRIAVFSSKLNLQECKDMGDHISSKYVIAQINIPIEILPNTQLINHNDRITVQIIKTDKLPPKSDINNEEILQTIQELIDCNDISDVIPIKVEGSAPYLTEDENNQNHSNTVENSDNITNKETTEVSSNQHIIHYNELLKKRHRLPSKNNTFKQQKYKTHNKTKSTRWIFMKDTKGAGY